MKDTLNRKSVPQQHSYNKKNDQAIMEGWGGNKRGNRRRCHIHKPRKRERLTVNPVNPFGFSDMDGEQN